MNVMDNSSSTNVDILPNQNYVIFGQTPSSTARGGTSHSPDDPCDGVGICTQGGAPFSGPSLLSGISQNAILVTFVHLPASNTLAMTFAYSDLLNSNQSPATIAAFSVINSVPTDYRFANICVLSNSFYANIMIPPYAAILKGTIGTYVNDSTANQNGNVTLTIDFTTVIANVVFGTTVNNSTQSGIALFSETPVQGSLIVSATIPVLCTITEINGINVVFNFRFSRSLLYDIQPNQENLFGNTGTTQGGQYIFDSASALNSTNFPDFYTAFHLPPSQNGVPIPVGLECPYIVDPVDRDTITLILNLIYNV